MASNMQSFPRMLKMLRENSNTKEKREALTYIRSNSNKLESMNSIKEEQYKELCKLVIDAFTNGSNDVQNEAYETLNTIIRDFKDHSLNLFEAMLRINKKNRLKILKLLEVIEDNATSTVAYDTHAVNFFNDCLCTIQTSTMPWIAATTCTDNLQVLIDAEIRPLSDDQRLEEETINYSINLLRRLYKVAAITSDTKIQRFDAVLLDKVMVLAYMGHKRQRSPALKLLQQALATNILSYVRTKLPDAWAQYKTALQNVYCKRMLHLVSACELDWATQWNISIQFLGVDLHRGAGLINNLLSVEEKAFKSTDTIIRRQAFLSWKLLIDNFALDPQELATARRIKLLCIPLNAKNSKTELIALTKLEVWWHVIIKLYKDITNFVNPVITQFLNFCFGPLGDTPLLSSKFDIVASPGKRFFKTKVVAVDALCQLLVTKQENHTVFSPMLEERLPHSISDSVFEECYKSIIHSVGEVLLVLSQLTDAEMKNRHQLGKILWKSLINYVQESKMPKKELMYRDMILVITELTNYAVDKPMIRYLFLDIILFEIVELSKNFNVQHDILFQLLLKLVQVPVLNEAKKNHYDALKCLLWQSIKAQTENEYYPHAFKCLKEMYEKIHTLSNEEYENETIIFELWLILAEVLLKYMTDLEEINEGNIVQHDLKAVESIVTFPFMYIRLKDQKQISELIKLWKSLYKQFEMRADLITTVKPNEILLNIASAMQCAMTKNENSYCLITNCLDSLLSSINYKCLIAHTGVPSIVYLMVKLITYFLSNKNNIECEYPLKALSAVLITIYGHDPQKVISYLQICKSAVELMLTSELESLYKEVSSTWETIISIFKGLNKLIDYDLISSYKKAIVQALNHSYPDIVTQTLSFLEMQSSLSSNVKLALEEIGKEVRKDEISNRFAVTKKKKNDEIGKLSNKVKMVGSFLNRRSSSSKPPVPREPDKTDNKVLSDPDSQDYVLIKTDLKFDVNRLTEHQIESFKRRREDIPALYNDLSQSSSQDTQHLQEWFDRRNKTLEEMDTPRTKTDDISMKNLLDYDANKENKIEIEGMEIIDKSVIESGTKSTEIDEQNECTQKANSIIETNANLVIPSEKQENANPNAENVPFINSIQFNKNILDKSADKTCDDLELNTSSEFQTKNLDFNSQEDFTEGKDNDQRLSPSILDNGKRHNRQSSCTTLSIPPKSNESTLSDQIDTIPLAQRMLMTKVFAGKSKVNNKQRISGNMENKPFDEEKRGVKRKSASDSESEGSNSSRRRKIASSEFASDSDSARSVESDSTAMNVDGMFTDGNLSQRTKNEISRLRINMVFDTSVPKRRRSKIRDDNKDSKDSSAKKQSSENKGLKLKVVDTKIGDSLKKSPKISDKELGSPQNAHKRRKLPKGMKSTSQGESNGFENEETMEEDKQTEGTSRNLSETEDTVFEDDISQNETQNTDLDERVTKDNTINRIEERLQAQDDMEDIIEDSQDLINLEKKCNEKQCFIKIAKIGDVVHVIKSHEATVEDSGVAENVSNNCDNDNDQVSKVNDKEFEETGDSNDSNLNILMPVIENSPCDNEKDVFEEQKTNEGSLIAKSLIGCSSPKTNSRRQLKFKPFTAQGRAAHMLGLVTKQTKMESESLIVNVDDESATKKGKSKDTEGESLLGKKERGPAVKEVDKVTGACSSRQEKIFSNMRSSDYCSSPPIKLFSNLKNDGEKVFSKIEKSVESAPMQTDSQVSDDSPPELDELPILEWSSANPPSLTAPPSASILKRHRQTIPEPEPESTTPSKRKRVSFADPPVSKEMGYEIPACGSPHKINKFASRGLLGRKDSPFRLKHFKQQLMHADSEKMDKEDVEEIDTANTYELDLQCEKENELLTKIAEELEYSENMAMDTDVPVPCNSAENELINAIPVEMNTCKNIQIDNLSVEFEITQKSIFSKHSEAKSTNEVDPSKKDEALPETTKGFTSSIETTECNNSETQEDMFNGIDLKQNDSTYANTDGNVNSAHSTTNQNTSLDSLKFNITDDSIINHSSEGHIQSENLEDTVDAQNLTAFNSTASSDEIFCGKLIRTSTQAVENVEEQDTLPVTDSVFGSLPSSQDSQNTSEFNLDIPHPEMLDSVQPIYPTLVLCQEPIKSIIEQLTYPSWVQHLTGDFADRNLQTIGDLAQLSEREVNRIPIKGNSKIEFVKSVLQCFEKTCIIKEAAKKTVQDLLSKATPEKIQMELVQPNVEELITNVVETDKNVSEKPKPAVEYTSDVLDTLSIVPCTLQESALEAKTIPSVSALRSRSSNMATTQMTSIPISSMVIANSASEDLAGNSNFNVTRKTSSTHPMRTVGTCTSSDSIYFSKTPPNKATKSVGAQMALEDLLDEIDVNLVLESAVRRCTPEKILLQYKNKMRHVPQAELETQTISMLGTETRKSCSEMALKAACRACGVNKILLRLPDIFSTDKQFFVKVLNTYRKKIKATDCLNILEFNEVKELVCQKCTSSELAEMLSNKLKEEEKEGIKTPMTELSSLDAMLKRMPRDVIISHTVANDELVPSRVVLDIALQNNSPSDIAQALGSQSSLVTKSICDKLWSPQFAVEYLERSSESKEDLFKILKAVSAKLNSQELLQAFYESMNAKVMVEQVEL